jgi:hypothetical protein
MSGHRASEPPLVVPPDDKDWTWVLTRPCEACGFDATVVSPAEIPGLIRTNATAWREILAGDDVGARPSPVVWSPLEYACHVRDVFRIYDQRLHRMLEEDDPLFANWDQDDTAVTERYWAQDPALVADELVAAADKIATSFAAVAGDGWHRPGRRSDGASFTVDTFARYFVHDPIHHLHDVRRSR